MASSSLRCLGLWVVLGLVLAHYVWTVLPSQGFYPYQHYHLLTDALRSGQLHLLVEPRPEMLQLPDPYEPAANAPYRNCIDCSLFEGRYFLYFGVAPVLTLFLPFRLLFGTHLPEKLAAALFMYGGFLFSALALRVLIRRFYPLAPFALQLGLLVLVAFSGFAPFILRRPMVYETTVAAGSFFVMGAVHWLVRAVAAERPRPGLLALGSLWLGLAAGSRPHYVLAAPLLVLAGLDQAHRFGTGAAVRRRLGLALGLPFLLCGLGLALYNYARYGAWLEFGQTYVVDGLLNHPRTRMFSLSYLPSHLFLNLFSLPSVDLNFPFFHMYPAAFPRLPHSRRVLESVAGVVACVPLTALSCLTPLFLLPPLRGGVALRPRLTAASMFLVGALLAGFVSCFLVTSVRYFADFCPILLLSSSIAWLHLDHLALGRRLARIGLSACLGLLLAFGTALNLGVGLTGFYDLYRKQRPDAYAAIEDRFVPLQRLLLRAGGRYGDLRMRVRFRPSAPGRAETLVAVGEDEGRDVLCVAHREDGRIVFRFRHGTEPPLESPPLAVAPGPHSLELALGSLLPRVNPRVLAKLYPAPDGSPPHQRLAVRLDGSEVLRGSYGFEAADPSLVSIGKGWGNEGCPSDFRGRVLELERRAP